MKYLYVLKVGETFPTTKEKLKDFDHWIVRFFKDKTIKPKVIDILKEKQLPKLESALGFIITGSHSMVTHEHPWSLQLESYIQKIAKTEIPLLGICYGHQLIAKALGGKSDFNKNGKEIGVVSIEKLLSSGGDPILEGFPKNFHAYETHYQTVVKAPKGAKVLAKNKKDSHQAVRYTTNIWGVQFHPEFDRYVMEEYIINQKEDLLKLGFDPDELISGLKSCDTSSKILTNFEKILKSK